jgi:hypothetical protein
MELNYNDCISGKYPTQSFYYSYQTQTLRSFLADVYDKCTGAGRLLKEQEIIKECEIEEVESPPEDSGLIFKIGITMIVFLGIMIIFLAYITYNFYKRSYKSDWNEVNFNAVSSNINSNRY